MISSTSLSMGQSSVSKRLMIGQRMMFSRSRRHRLSQSPQSSQTSSRSRRSKRMSRMPSSSSSSSQQQSSSGVGAGAGAGTGAGEAAGSERQEPCNHRVELGLGSRVEKGGEE